MKWDEKKRADRLVRLRSIVRESAEQSFRAVLPTLAFAPSLSSLLDHDSIVLSEVEGVQASLRDRIKGRTKATLVIGPEGGWSPREVEVIGTRATSLGPRVLRVDTAAAAACAIALSV